MNESFGRMLSPFPVPLTTASLQAFLLSNVNRQFSFAISQSPISRASLACPSAQLSGTQSPVSALTSLGIFLSHRQHLAEAQPTAQLCNWGYETYDVPCEDCPGMFESVVRVRLSERYCPICWPLSTPSPSPIPAFQENEAHPDTFGPCLPIQVAIDLGLGAGVDTVEHVDHILSEFFDEFFEEQEVDAEDDQGGNTEQSITEAKEEENNEESTENTQQEEAGGMGLSNAEEAKERELPTELEEDEMLDFELVRPRNRRQRRRQGRNARSELPNGADEPKLKAK